MKGGQWGNFPILSPFTLLSEPWWSSVSLFKWTDKQFYEAIFPGLLKQSRSSVVAVSLVEQSLFFFEQHWYSRAILLSTVGLGARIILSVKSLLSLRYKKGERGLQHQCVRVPMCPITINTEASDGCFFMKIGIVVIALEHVSPLSVQFPTVPYTKW
jgi:hypothetical protein